MEKKACAGEPNFVLKTALIMRWRKKKKWTSSGFVGEWMVVLIPVAKMLEEVGEKNMSLILDSVDLS